MTHVVFLTRSVVASIWHRLTSPRRRVKVGVRRDLSGGLRLFDIQLQAIVRATPQQTWVVLTDYARLPEFVPDLICSTVVAQGQDEKLVEQRGRAGFLFFHQLVHMVVRVTEQPLSTLEVSLVSGNMKTYHSHWALAPFDEGRQTQIDYHGQLEPDFYVPQLVGRLLVEQDTRRMLTAVIKEIERRAHAPS